MAILLFGHATTAFLLRNAQDGFQSPSWRFFYLDNLFWERRCCLLAYVSIAFMAILLFGRSSDQCLAKVDLSFNRLHGDSFIWTPDAPPRHPSRQRVSIAFMAILLFGRESRPPPELCGRCFNRLHGDSFIWTLKLT